VIGYVSLNAQNHLFRFRLMGLPGAGRLAFSTFMFPTNSSNRSGEIWKGQKKPRLNINTVTQSVKYQLSRINQAGDQCHHCCAYRVI